MLFDTLSQVMVVPVATESVKDVLLPKLDEAGSANIFTKIVNKVSTC